mmetsp:Transcript_62078/g.183449  ORF Transcript_62078/g.183449 Transcript_62078/m.183449 type:complete len:185 (-) Transcript_62078:603-1157(-)
MICIFLNSSVGFLTEQIREKEKRVAVAGRFRRGERRAEEMSHIACSLIQKAYVSERLYEYVLELPKAISACEIFIRIRGATKVTFSQNYIPSKLPHPWYHGRHQVMPGTPPLGCPCDALVHCLALFVNNHLHRVRAFCSSNWKILRGFIRVNKSPHISLTVCQNVLGRPSDAFSLIKFVYSDDR